MKLLMVPESDPRDAATAVTEVLHKDQLPSLLSKFQVRLKKSSGPSGFFAGVDFYSNVTQRECPWLLTQSDVW